MEQLVKFLNSLQFDEKNQNSNFSVGAGILYQITPDSYVQSHQLGSNGLFTMLNATCDNQANDTSLCIDENLSVTPFQGLIIEHIGTLILTMTVLSITDSRAEQYWSPSLMIGLTVALCHLLMIPYTGCSVVSIFFS